MHQPITLHMPNMLRARLDAIPGHTVQALEVAPYQSLRSRMPPPTSGPNANNSAVQAPELTQLQSFKGGQMGQALADAFLRMDELLSRQEARAILEQLAGKGGKNKQKCVLPWGLKAKMLP